MKKPSNQLTSLHQVVNTIIGGAQTLATKNNSTIRNEVDPGIAIDCNNAKLLTLMDELLEAVIMNSRDGEIHISADRYSDVVILSIEERNNFNGYALSYSVSSMEREAVSVGGHISIKGPQQRVATVSFSFPVQAAA